MDVLKYYRILKDAKERLLDGIDSESIQALINDAANDVEVWN